MNSAYLKKTHPQVYKDFFSSHDVVMSGCLGFGWVSGTLGKEADVFNIQQKLPLSCYVGSKRTDGGSLSIQSIVNYVLDGQFVSVDIHKYIGVYSQRESILMHHYQKRGGKGAHTLDVLIECTRGHGLGRSGTIASVLVTQVAVLSGVLNAKQLADYGQFVQSDLWHQLVDIARQLELCNRNNNSLGLASSLALNSGTSPLVGVVTSHDDHHDRHIVHLHSLCTHPLDGSMAIDYCLVFSGLLNNTHQTEQLKRADQKHLEQIRTFVLEKFGHIDSPVLQQFKDEDLYRVMSKTYSLFSVKMLYLMTQIVEYGDYPEIVDKIITHINDMRHYIRMVERSDGFAECFVKEFSLHQSHGDERVGIVPLDSAKHGGNYLVVTRRGYSRKTLARALQSLQTRYQDSSLQYASWEDGEEASGIQLLQDISHNTYSEYVDKHHVVYLDNQGNKKIDTYENLLHECKDGILLDAIAGKVLIQGQKVTSSQLKSQSTTVEVLGYLMEAIGKPIPSSKLGYSSYTGQYNQMQGKIIGPLVKLCQEVFGEQLPLTAKSQGGSYAVTLDKTDIHIGIVKPIVL